MATGEALRSADRIPRAPARLKTRCLIVFSILPMQSAALSLHDGDHGRAPFRRSKERL